MNWRGFDLTLAKARSKFADIPNDALEALIEEAVAATRKEHPLAPG